MVHLGRCTRWQFRLISFLQMTLPRKCELIITKLFISLIFQVVQGYLYIIVSRLLSELILYLVVLRLNLSAVIDSVKSLKALGNPFYQGIEIDNLIGPKLVSKTHCHILLHNEQECSVLCAAHLEQMPEIYKLGIVSLRAAPKGQI